MTVGARSIEFSLPTARSATAPLSAAVSLATEFGSWWLIGGREQSSTESSGI